MLKADFHLHTKEDPRDTWIKYNAKELIDRAEKLGFDVLAITNHWNVCYNKRLADYAKKKNILLIPGTEARIEGKDVVILNAANDAAKIKKFSELRDFKKKNPESFIMAPHPFYVTSICLGKKLFKYSDIFDGVEYCHCYLSFFNRFNKKAVKSARKYNKVLIGTSDMHQTFQLNKTYSLVDADKNTNSVIKALKNGKVEIKTKPLSISNWINIFFPMFKRGIKRYLF